MTAKRWGGALLYVLAALLLLWPIPALIDGRMTGPVYLLAAPLAVIAARLWKRLGEGKP